MDPIGQFREEHAWIRREMDGIDAFLAAEGLDRPEELRERVRALWIFLVRHERLEEQWMAGQWMTPPSPVSEGHRRQAHREHGDIISALESLGEVLARFDGPAGGGPVPSAERQAVRCTVEGVFRFLREHLAREDAGLLGAAGAQAPAAAQAEE